MGQKRLVTVVIPFYNQVYYLLQTLRSIALNPSPRFHTRILLFDNASEESVDTVLLDQMGLDWVLFRNEVNLAVSKPWNEGIRLSLQEHGADAVCLLNSDVIVGAGWIDHCVQALDEGAYCSFPFSYTDGGALPQDFVRRAKLAAAGRLQEAYDNMRVRQKHLPGEDYYADGHWHPPQELFTAHETDGFCGFCFFVSPQCIEKIGYIDDEMTLVYSDTDYRNRLIAAFRHPVCVHRCLIHHFGSRTIRPLRSNYRQEKTMANDKSYFERKWESEYNRVWRNHCIGKSAAC
jgi:GT2 family glycosyltransferase